MTTFGGVEERRQPDRACVTGLLEPKAGLQGLWCPRPLLAQWTRSGPTGRRARGRRWGDGRCDSRGCNQRGDRHTRARVLPLVRPCTLSSVALKESCVGFDRVLGIPTQTRQGAQPQNSDEMSHTGAAPLRLWSQERLRWEDSCQESSKDRWVARGVVGRERQEFRNPGQRKRQGRVRGD